MMRRAWMSAVLALAAAAAAHAQVDFGDLNASQYVPPVTQSTVPAVTQVGVPPAADKGGAARAPDAFEPAQPQPEDTPGATWNSYRYGRYGYYPRTYNHMNNWHQPTWYTYGYGPYQRYGWRYDQGGWYGTDPRWYYTNPAYRTYGWRDRAYPYAWYDGSLICSW